jgi:hypothetical protein
MIEPIVGELGNERVFIAAFAEANDVHPVDVKVTWKVYVVPAVNPEKVAELTDPV